MVDKIGSTQMSLLSIFTYEMIFSGTGRNEYVKLDFITLVSIPSLRLKQRIPTYDVRKILVRSTRPLPECDCSLQLILFSNLL